MPPTKGNSDLLLPSRSIGRYSMRPPALTTLHGWLMRNHGTPSSRRIALMVAAVAILFGCGSTTTVIVRQGGQGGGHIPTVTTAPHATATHIIPTHTPVPPQPTPTNAPQPPNIAGSYGGYFTSYSQNGGYPMTQILSCHSRNPVSQRNCPISRQRSRPYRLRPLRATSPSGSFHSSVIYKTT